MPEYRVWPRNEPERFRFVFSQNLRDALDEGAEILGRSRWEMQGERVVPPQGSGCGTRLAAASIALAVLLGALAALAEVL